jgi:DNA-directed RNA polymerase subunit M
MDFCPKCGSILVQKAKNSGCPRCSYSHKGKLDLKTSEKLEDFKEVAVISNKKDVEVNPIVEMICKKCGHSKAYFWTMQTRSSDEAETKFFKCVKCDHTWRDYN